MRQGVSRESARLGVSIELPIPAETAFRLAQKPELFKFVVAPILRVPALHMPDQLEPGAEGSM